MTVTRASPATSIAALLQGARDEPSFLGARDGRFLDVATVVSHADEWTRRFAGGVPDGPVALSRRDPLDFALDFLALLAAGATVAPLDPGLPAHAMAADLAELRPALVVGDAVPLTEPAALRPRGLATVLLRSSGTTGPRKIVLLDERRLLHTAHAVAADHGLGSSDRGLCPLPLFHINAEVVGLLATLAAGGSLVLDDRFHRSDFWATAGAHQVTWVNAVPAILTLLAHDPAPVAPPASIRFVRSASAPLPLAVLTRFEQRFAIPIVETYGMTEAASQICANPVDGPRKPGSVGRPVATELQVRAEPGAVGEVLIRGGGVVAGPLPGGWLATGDLGYLDTDGYLFLTGRTTEVINRGGEKVFPRHVEEELLTDGRVAEAVVVGLPDDVLGEVPVAFVVAHAATGVQPGDGNVASAAYAVDAVAAVDDRAGANRLAGDLLTLATARLPRARRPRAVYVVAALPTGPTGKPSRGRVRAGAAALAATAAGSARAARS